MNRNAGRCRLWGVAVWTLLGVALWTLLEKWRWTVAEHQAHLQQAYSSDTMFEFEVTQKSSVINWVFSLANRWVSNFCVWNLRGRMLRSWFGYSQTTGHTNNVDQIMMSCWLGPLALHLDTAPCLAPSANDKYCDSNIFPSLDIRISPCLRITRQKAASPQNDWKQNCPTNTMSE